MYPILLHQQNYYLKKKRTETEMIYNLAIARWGLMDLIREIKCIYRKNKLKVLKTKSMQLFKDIVVQRKAGHYTFWANSSL